MLCADGFVPMIAFYFGFLEVIFSQNADFFQKTLKIRCIMR